MFIVETVSNRYKLRRSGMGLSQVGQLEGGERRAPRSMTLLRSLAASDDRVATDMALLRSCLHALFAGGAKVGLFNLLCGAKAPAASACHS